MIESFIQNERQLVLSGLCPKCGGKMVSFGSEWGYDEILKGEVEDFSYECDFCKIGVTVTFLKGVFSSFDIDPESYTG